MTDLPLAHVGHWSMWVLYMVPVIVVLFATIRSYLEQRRERIDGVEERPS
jgi:hypothetical protein